MEELRELEEKHHTYRQTKLSLQWVNLTDLHQWEILILVYLYTILPFVVTEWELRTIACLVFKISSKPKALWFCDSKGQRNNSTEQNCSSLRFKLGCLRAQLTGLVAEAKSLQFMAARSRVQSSSSRALVMMGHICDAGLTGQRTEQAAAWSRW